MPESYLVNINDGPNSAIDDVKDLSADVRRHLFQVIRTELREAPRVDDADEGQYWPDINPRPWMWRRGVTPDDRKMWNKTLSLEPESKRLAADYVIVYRFFTYAEARLYRYHERGDYPGYYIWRIFSIDMFAESVVERYGL